MLSVSICCFWTCARFVSACVLSSLLPSRESHLCPLVGPALNRVSHLHDPAIHLALKDILYSDPFF